MKRRCFSPFGICNLLALISCASLVPTIANAQLGLTNYVFTLSYVLHSSLIDDGGLGTKLVTANSLLQNIHSSTCNPGDTRACITLTTPIAPPSTFTATDGVISNQAEQDAVFGVSANLKIVAGIGFCGGLGTYVGCTLQPTRNMIVVRTANADTYAHEFGHAQNNNDNFNCTRYIMCSGCAGPRNVVTPTEAANYMTPTHPYSIGSPCQVPLPSIQHSYFVPQTGAGGEGQSAVTLLRGCPNNDGTSFPNNVRIKVVVRDDNGAPITGLASTDIYLHFNGGTPVQGFSGTGADSIIANTVWNYQENCPTVYAVYADAGTDGNGIAYITLKGPGGNRDANRKWGHYDASIPVVVNGVRINGRLTSSDPSPYDLRIKNVDWTGGLGAQYNQGEAVSVQDFNGLANDIGDTGPISYWKDFDSSGQVTINDLNLLNAHLNHDCNSPSY